MISITADKAEAQHHVGTEVGAAVVGKAVGPRDGDVGGPGFQDLWARGAATGEM